MVLITGIIGLMVMMLPENVRCDDLPRVIAHRGASFEAPENTLAAIRLALEQGARIIEFDVRKTADDRLVLFHDKDLKRICGIEKKIEDLSFEEVLRLNAGFWFEKKKYAGEKVPSLEDAIKLCLVGEATPLIERKSGSPELYAGVLENLKAEEKVIVQSFDWSFIAGLKALLPKLALGALGEKSLSKRKEKLLALRPRWVGWRHRDITRSDIQWLKENRFQVAVWTVNDPKEARSLIGQGVDRIITDRPKIISGEAAKSGG